MNWLRDTRRWAGLGLLLGAAACVDAPELEGTVPRDLHRAQYPVLMPLDDALFADRLPQEQSEDIGESLEARRARLEARAQKLRADVVVDPESRKRLENAVAR